MNLPSNFKRGTARQIAWDSTSIKSFRTCPRKYQYEMIFGARSKRPSIHLWFGGHYASALERFHKHRANGMEYTEALRETVRQLLIDTYPDRDFEAPRSYKGRWSLLRSVIWYLVEFKNDVMQTLITADDKPAVEYSFALDIGNGIIYAGHLDRGVVFSGDNYVQDQKSTGSTITPRYFKGYDLDDQFTGYAMAGRIIWKTPIKGVSIDAVQVAEGFSRFERGFTFRTEEQIDEWLSEVHRLVDYQHSLSAELEANDEFLFPKNTTACGNFGGCVFAGICSAPRSMRKAGLAADFAQKWWNPLESR